MARGAVDFRILGPVQVWTDAGPADLGTPKQRAMLALLLLHAGEVVSTDRLADLLWDGEPPRGPR
jgi:DNA-binding SARP family transcriptional activator